MRGAMSTITAVVLAAFVGYGAAWYFGAVEGNFSLLLFLASVVTGIYWLAERFYFLPQRHQAVAALEEATAKRRAELAEKGINQVDNNLDEAKTRLIMQPWWLDWTAGLFPVIVVVFLLRSFLFEPFKIPSGSMIPTLLINDLILVNKFHYGVRLPVLNIKVLDNNSPQRGDVMVFRYPPKPSLDYIKRVVGVPGDEVAYLNKKLTINGQPVTKTPCRTFSTRTPCSTRSSSRRISAARRTAYSTMRTPRPSSTPTTTSLTRTTAATASKAWFARCPKVTIS
jgi:signal peptidase I